MPGGLSSQICGKCAMRIIHKFVHCMLQVWNEHKRNNYAYFDKIKETIRKQLWYWIVSEANGSMFMNCKISIMWCLFFSPGMTKFQPLDVYLFPQCNYLFNREILKTP